MSLVHAAGDGKWSKLCFQKWFSSYSCRAASTMDAASRMLLIAVALYSYCSLYDVDVNHVFKINPVLTCGK